MEDEDKESKTEEPTEKRISDALEKGNIPVARDMILMGSIAGLVSSVALLGHWAAYSITASLKSVLESVGGIHLHDREMASVVLLSVVASSAVPLIVIMLLISAGSITASILQNMPRFSGQRVEPQVSRVSPLSGWRRLFSKEGLGEFLKSSCKLITVMFLLWFLFEQEMPRFTASLRGDPGTIPQLILDAIIRILLPILGLASVLAIADVVWTRLRWKRDLRMSLQEIKDEMKQAEGDPLLKGRLRSIWRQRASRRMLEKLPTASMVITNPTHFAVALRYVREEGGAPVLIAKGVDHLAKKIRDIAETNAVPLVENKPLARGLYEQVELDEQIPPEFYHAVAEIIHYLNKTGRMPIRRDAN